MLVFKHLSPKLYLIRGCSKTELHFCTHQWPSNNILAPKRFARKHFPMMLSCVFYDCVFVLLDADINSAILCKRTDLIYKKTELDLAGRCKTKIYVRVKVINIRFTFFVKPPCSLGVNGSCSVLCILKVWIDSSKKYFSQKIVLHPRWGTTVL